MKRKEKIILSLLIVIFLGLCLRGILIGNKVDELPLGDTYVTGDINGDGKVSVADYNLVRKHILGTKLTGEKLKKSDINGDGKVSVADYVSIRKIILGIYKPTSTSTPIATSTPKPTSTPSNGFKINYYGNGATSGSVQSHTCNMNETCTIKANGFTKSGYTFSGWTTNSNGADDGYGWTGWSGKWVYTNGQYGIANNTVNLYAVWEKKYIITEDTKYSGYTNIASYNSNTLKYRVISYQGQDIILVYVEDAYMQLNSALASPDALHSKSAEELLNTEINTYGYQNKGMIAVNASFYSPTDNANGTPHGGVVFSHGKLVKNTGDSSALFGVTPNGMIKTYINQSASVLNNDKIRNTFVFSSIASDDYSTAVANRTQICQYDKNNFVLLSGSGRVKWGGEVIASLTGCGITYNLDGGGSRKLYYKTSSSSTMTKRFGGGRIIPDMLIFVEQ